MAAGTVASPDWLKQYGATGTATGGAGQDRSNINWLLNPYVALPETQMQGAEGAVAGGFSGSGFAGARTNKLLDSERIARMKLGHELLEPYLQREFQGAQNEADRQARLQQIAAEGAAALQRLQLQEAGLGSRLSEELRAKLEDRILQGQQALEQINVKESGDTARNNASIRGNIVNTLLKNYGTEALGGRTGTATGGYVPSYQWQTDYNTGRIIGGVAPPTVRNPTATGASPASGAGITGSRITSATIDSVLRRYGIL